MKMNSDTTKVNSESKKSLYDSFCQMISMAVYHKLNKNDFSSNNDCVKSKENVDEINFLIASIFQRWLRAHHIEGLATSSVQDKLKRLSETMDGKSHDLTQKFQILYNNSQNQSKYMQELMQLSSGILIEEKLIPIEEIAVHVLNTLSISTKALHQLAERARLMSDRVSEATQTLQEIETSIKAIGLINKKTKYLSLNAMIEALKEQQGKEGTMAVANEVRELSNGTQTITTIIADQSEKMRDILDDAKKTLEDVASFDFTQTMDAELFIRKMIDGLVNNNKRMNVIMDITAESTKEFSETASSLIKGMQYEDRTQQDIQNVVREIAGIKELFDNLPEETKKMLEEHLKSFMKENEETQVCNQTYTSPSELLTSQEKEGDITLF